MSDNSLSPVDIKLHKASAQLDITWADGTESHLLGATLRQFCACSTCRARNIVGKSLITNNNTIDDVQMAGIAGLQIVFADGHDRGVFPWAYLRAIDEGRALEHLNA